MNTSELIAQMAYAAGQVTMPQLQPANTQAEAKPEKEFKALLNEKKAEAGQQTPQKPKAEAKKESALGADSVTAGETVAMPYFQGMATNVVQMPLFADLAQSVGGQALGTPMAGAAVDLSGALPTELLAQAMFAAEEAANTVQAAVLPGDARIAQNTDGLSINHALAETAVPEKAIAEGTALQGDYAMQTETDDAVVLDGAAEAQSRPLFSSVEDMPVKVGESYTVDAEQADFGSRLADTLTTALKSGEQRVEIRLMPENLGSIKVELTRTADGLLRVVLQADTDKGMRLLGEHSTALGLMLKNSGQGEVRVEVSQPKQDNQPWQQNQQDGHSQREGNQERRQDDGRQNDDFLQKFRLGLFAEDNYAV